MLQECSIWNIARIFFNEPTKQHYLMEISQKSKIAHTSVKHLLTKLKKLSIIKEFSEKKGSRNFPVYKADLESKEYKKYKKIYNLINVEESGLIDFLNDNFMPNCIILFGSYFRGEDIEDSDIDLFVGCKKKEIDLNKFKRYFNKKIELHFNDNFNNYQKELKNNIINGVVLRGYLEAF